MYISKPLYYSIEPGHQRGVHKFMCELTRIKITKATGRRIYYAITSDSQRGIVELIKLITRLNDRDKKDYINTKEV